MDPRRYCYSGTACPDFRKSAATFWLHPARYRTQPCKDGTACHRRFSFFADTPDQLRVLSPSQQQGSKSPRGSGDGGGGVAGAAASPLAESYDGLPLRLAESVRVPAIVPGRRRRAPSQLMDRSRLPGQRRARLDQATPPRLPEIGAIPPDGLARWLIRRRHHPPASPYAVTVRHAASSTVAPSSSVGVVLGRRVVSVLRASPPPPSKP
uniref:Uncharacterized protein n=1 Tax=Oryza sativa subsp. indica TaxID=39946 RepID=C5NNV3_ORYSI|nr:hypothetical protein [Oryza sativa Indica Group]